ncbi:exosome catalytic subunit dis3, partial [Perkinsus olseni]
IRINVMTDPFRKANTTTRSAANLMVADENTTTNKKQRLSVDDNGGHDNTSPQPPWARMHHHHQHDEDEDGPKHGVSSDNESYDVTQLSSEEKMRVIEQFSSLSTDEISELPPEVRESMETLVREWVVSQQQHPGGDEWQQQEGDAEGTNEQEDDTTTPHHHDTTMQQQEGEDNAVMSVEYGNTTATSASIPVLSPHIVIIPTPSVCIKQLDWLCDSCDVDGWHLGNVVITYTALNALKHAGSRGRSAAAATGGSRQGSYDRLRNRCRTSNITTLQHTKEEGEGTSSKSPSSTSLTSNFYVFANEHCRDTFVPMEMPTATTTTTGGGGGGGGGGEDSLDDNDDGSDVNDTRDLGCTLKVAQWYDNHLGIPNASLVLCNDNKCKEKAQRMGYKGDIITCQELCDSKLHEVYPTCSEKLASSTLASTATPDNMADDGGYTVSTWQRGKVILKDDNNNEVHMRIRGRFNINRAVDGDVVAVEEISQATGNGDDDDDGADAVPTTATEAMEERITGDDGNQSRQEGEDRIFIPANPRIPNIRIATKHSNDLDNMRICVAIDSWDRTSRLPQGHWTRILGKCGERDTESSVILHEHNVITREFSDDVMRCLPPKDFQPDEEEISRRLDLRDVTVCSIDPPGCKDIDDAL